MAVTRFNIKRACKTIMVGSLIEISRGLYSHFAMYIGGGKCIHLTCGTKPNSLIGRFLKLFQKGTVQIDDLKDILGSCIGIVNNELDGELTPKKIKDMLSSAKSMIGQPGYSVFFRNCETMCNYWRYGVPTSLQVMMVLEIMMAIGAGIVVGGVVKELLDRAVGSFASMVAGVVAGCATTAGLLFYEAFKSKALSAIVTKISGFAMSGWVNAGLATCLGVGAVVGFGYGVYKLVTSETFKSTVHAVADTVYEVGSSLYQAGTSAASTVYSYGTSAASTVYSYGTSAASTVYSYGKWALGW